jgi:acetylornithine deacetylase/succinyl-diaminopimelate desuccinylase-like protein
VRRLRLTARTEGGHSWLHFGRPSAIHALAGLAAQLAGLPLPESPKTTYNIGVIAGGTSVNTIAAEASLQLDLRSEAPAALQALVAQVEALARAAAAPGVEVAWEVIGDRPAGGIPREHPLVRLAAASLEAASGRREKPAFENGSTDANVPLSLGLPCVCVGLTRGGNAHRCDEYIETEPLEIGLKQLVMLALGSYEL